jgi:hypothetical protein
LMKEALLSKCAELPSELVNTLLSKFSVNGAVPVTLDDIKTLLNSVVAQMRSELRNALPSSLPSGPAPLIDPNLDPRFHLWSWGNRMRMVPSGWLFPSTDMKATWNLWHFGHVGDHIRPLRYLQKSDLRNPSQVTLWSKSRGVMTEIAEVMVEMKVAPSTKAVEELSATDSAEAFDRAAVRLMERVREGSTRASGKRRWVEMSIPTLYSLVVPMRKKRREEEKRQREGVDGGPGGVAAGEQGS